MNNASMDLTEIPTQLNDEELTSADTDPAANLVSTTSLAPPTYNTVRISCHGEYTTNSSLTYFNPSKIKEIKDNPNYIQFHIFFRAEVGRCVLARRTTELQTNTEGVTCSLQEKENSDFGIHDFKKEMIIYVNVYNYNEYYIESVLSRSYREFPNILFSFNTDYEKEGMYLGYALYNTEDGIIFTPKKNCGFEQLSKLSEYSLELINRSGSNLIQKLLDTYKNTDFQGLSKINLYISSCLYVRTTDIPRIEKFYKEWFESHSKTIGEEYEGELQDTIKEIDNVELKKGGIERYIKELENTKPNEELERKIRNLDTFLKILNNKVDSLLDYVPKYLEGNVDECPIDELNNKIDEFDVKGITDASRIKQELIKNLEEKQRDLQIDAELMDDDDNPELQKSINELYILKNKLDLKKDELLKIQSAIQKCSSQPGSRSGVRRIDEEIIKKKNNNSNRDWRDRSGGGKKLKKTLKKKKGGKKKKITLKKGALTKQAKSHGYKDVMKFARLTMRLHKQGKKTYPNGKRITKLLVKRSNFAVNFNKKK